MTAFLVDMHPGQPTVATITRHQARVLEAFLRDGADNDTLARRLGMTPGAVREALGRVQTAAGMPTRTALAIAVLRHDVVLRVQPSHASARGRRAS